MNKLVEIKKIDISKIDEALDVIHKSFKTVAIEFGLTKENAKGNAAFINKGKLISDEKSGNMMYGLFYNNKIIGFMQLKNKDSSDYTLENLSILPEYRGEGYGKLLIDFAKSEVKSLSGKKLSLGCIYENTKLVNWYIKNGFIYKGKKSFKKYPYTVGFFEYIFE